MNDYDTEVCSIARQARKEYAELKRTGVKSVNFRSIIEKIAKNSTYAFSGNLTEDVLTECDRQRKEHGKKGEVIKDDFPRYTNRKTSRRRFR